MLRHLKVTTLTVRADAFMMKIAKFGYKEGLKVKEVNRGSRMIGDWMPWQR